MARLDDYPELKAVFDKLTEEQTSLREQSADLWSRYNELQESITPMQNEMRDLQQQIQGIERPRLGQIADQLAAIARAIGGRSTSDRIVSEVIEANRDEVVGNEVEL